MNRLRKMGFLKWWLLTLFLLFPFLIHAQVLPPCTATGNCGICDFVQTFINIIRWVLGVLGGTALFLMVWHGFSWLTAMGNAEKVESGRKGLMHTVIGMAIILVAWFLVNAVISLLMTPAGALPSDDFQSLFNPSEPLWYQACQAGASQAFCRQGHGEGTPCGGGKFCLIRNGEMTCSNTNSDKTITYDNACHYWHEHPTRYEYRNTCKDSNIENCQPGYYCVKNSNNCQSGKTLGADFCSNSKEEVCCEPIDPSDSGSVIPFNWSSDNP